MGTTTTRELDREQLAHIAEVVWTEVVKFCQPNACIIGTRVLCDVLDALGHRGWQALSVTGMAMNSEAARHIKRHGCMGTDDRCRLLCPDGAIGVLGGRIGKPGLAPLTWGGHLVAIVDRRWVVDMSVSQVNVPERDLNFRGPVIVETRPGFVRGRKALEHTTDVGCRLLYFAQPHERSWQTAPDWTLSSTLRNELVRGSLRVLAGRPPGYSQMMLTIRSLVGRV